MAFEVASGWQHKNTTGRPNCRLMLSAECGTFSLDCPVLFFFLIARRRTDAPIFPSLPSNSYYTKHDKTEQPGVNISLHIM